MTITSSEVLPAAIKTIKAESMSEPPGLSGFRMAGYSSKFTVANFTNDTIYTLTQDGATVAIPSERRNVRSEDPRPHLLITVEHEVIGNRPSYESNSLWEQAKQEKKHLSLTNRMLMEYVEDRLSSNPNFSRLSEIKTRRGYIIHESAIREAGKAHILEVDLVVSFEKDLLFHHHPASPYSWSAPDLRNRPESKYATGSMMIAVDNDRVYDSLFYYANNQIFEVKTIQDDKKEQGIHYSILVHGESGPQFNTTHYTFEEAREKLGIYPTRQAAATNGNPEVIQNAAQLETRKRLEELKNENEAMRIEADKQKIAHDREIALLKLNSTVQRENIETRSLERKTEYEEKKMNREQEDLKFESKHKRKEMKMKTALEKNKAKLEKANATIKTIETGSKILLAAAGIFTAVYATAKTLNKSKTVGDGIISAFSEVFGPSDTVPSLDFRCPVSGQAVGKGEGMTPEDLKEYNSARSIIQSLEELDAERALEDFVHPYPDIEEQEKFEYENAVKCLTRIQKRYPKIFGEVERC